MESAQEQPPQLQTLAEIDRTIAPFTAATIVSVTTGLVAMMIGPEKCLLMI